MSLGKDSSGSADGSVVVPLRRPVDGLLARLGLIASAEQRLDLQYYLWDSDGVGYLVLDRLLAAADRGVAVRILIDDLKFRRRTHAVASLCLHPNLSVRVFNPWTDRSTVVAHALEFIRRFGTLDRRMHNKLLVADGRAVVFGGRNIADEHFGLGEKFNLVDLDLLLSGPDAAEFTDVFDSYWNSAAAKDGASLGASVSQSDLRAARDMINRRLREREAELIEPLAAESRWQEHLTSPQITIGRGSVSVTYDEPGPTDDAAPTQVIDSLRRAVAAARHDLVAVTPFFVPSEIDVEWYRSIVDRGVRFRILTNSLASNMGTISNSGLSKVREGLVRAGVELHELRTDASAKADWETPPRVARYLGLHAKAYVIDWERTYLGSVNLDPRSKYINTEIGVLIDDRRLAESTADGIVTLMELTNSWKVDVGSDQRLRWRNADGTQGRQPARNAVQRIADTVFGTLPIGRYI